MRLEIIFKPETETTQAMSVDFIECTKGENSLNLDWDESEKWVDKNGYHHLYARGVYINEEYGNDRISELKGSVVSGIQLYNHDTDEEEFSCEIKTLAIFDNEEWYSFPGSALSCFPNKKEKSDTSKNTRISYLYRDACNYKQPNEEIIAGVFTREQIKTILDCLDDGCFVPYQVGFSEIRFGEITENDTCWFELNENGFKETNAAPTTNMTPDEVVAKFLAAKGNWIDTEMEYDEYYTQQTRF